MELIGIQRARGRDLATGIVLGAGLGLAALFLYLDTTYHNTTGAAVTILFGSIFAIPRSTIPRSSALSVAALAIVARALPAAPAQLDEPRARGRARASPCAWSAPPTCSRWRSRWRSRRSRSARSSAPRCSSDPAATALRLTKRPGRGDRCWPAVLGVAAMWLGIVLAYDSYYWPPRGHGWPVSFFVVDAGLRHLPALRASRLRARRSASRRRRAGSRSG